jgi:hypothetical protein
VLREATSSIINETLRVDEVNLSAGLLSGHSLKCEEAHQLRSNTDTCRACTEEKYAVVCKRTTRSGGGKFCCIYEPAENYSTSALDIIIEDGVFSSVSFKVLERVVC